MNIKDRIHKLCLFAHFFNLNWQILPISLVLMMSLYQKKFVRYVETVIFIYALLRFLNHDSLALAIRKKIIIIYIPCMKVNFTNISCAFPLSNLIAIKRIVLIELILIFILRISFLSDNIQLR
jgi:hypothetical protein